MVFLRIDKLRYLQRGDVIVSELARIGRAQPNPDCDVVFVHGLNGDGKTSWAVDGHADSFWPAWLEQDLERAAIWSVSYDIKALSWSGGTMPLVDRANNILSLLVSNGIGARPIAFVCHSFGGLIVKQMLRNAFELGDADWKKLAENTKGVLFLSTPHAGSNKANWFLWFAKILAPSVAVEELQSQDAQLRNLNQWYRQNAPKYGIETAALYETRATKGLLIVDPGSADPGVSVPVPVDTDHIGISKPASRDSHLYTAVRHYLRTWLSNDFAKQIHSRVVVRIDLGPDVVLSDYLKTAAIEEGSATFPDGSLDFPAGSLVQSTDSILYFAIKKPSVALRSSIEFMQRWHVRVLGGSPDCRVTIDEGHVPESGSSPVLRTIDPTTLPHLPPSALYVSEAIVDSADRTMATFSRISLAKRVKHSCVFRAEFEDPRTVRDSSLIHALFVAHPEAETVRKRLFELFLIEYLTINTTIEGTKAFLDWLDDRGLPVPEANWVREIIASSEYFERCPSGKAVCFKMRDAQAAQIEEHRKTFDDSKADCVRLVEKSIVDATHSSDSLAITDSNTLIEEYLSAVFLEIRLMANYLRRTDQVFDSSATPLKKFEYILNRRLGGLSAAAMETWRNGFIRGLKKAAEASNVYVASLFHNVLATYYLNRSQSGIQYQRNKLRGRTLYIDTNVLYAARVQASSYCELVRYLIQQLRGLDFDLRIFPFSVQEFEHSLATVQNAIHDGVPEPWVLQRLPWIYQEFKLNRAAYLTISACRQVHSIAKKEQVSPADYDLIDEQLKPLGVSLERDFEAVDEHSITDMWSRYVNQMGSNRWDYAKWWEFRQNAINRSAHIIRHDVLTLVNVTKKAERAGADEFGPKALFLTLDSDHLLRLRRTHSFILGVQQCQEYFLPYVFLNDIPVKQVIEFPNQLLSAQLGILLLKYRPRAIEIVESTLRSPSPWQLMDSDKLPTAYRDVARSFNQDRLRETVQTAKEQPEMVAAIAEQVGGLLEAEADKALREEYAARRQGLAVEQLNAEIEKEKEDKRRIQAELDRARKENKYLKTQRRKTTRR
jgi:hypothetical protein